MGARGRGSIRHRRVVNSTTTLENPPDTHVAKAAIESVVEKDGSWVTASKQLSAPWDDLSNMVLLFLLYAMQGIPLGLTIGAMPFMLGSKLSMTQMGVFSIAAYPYSFKLLWSPLVDGLYSRVLGRRKTWLLPTQLALGALLVASADWMNDRYEQADVVALTVVFLLLVMLAATQDIAVDGWALTLLKPHNLLYASTCQTLGMTSGYFTSFTVFLALSNPQFCNRYVRNHQLMAALAGPPSNVPIVTLPGYVRFWGWVFIAATIAIATLKSETPSEEERAAAKEASGAWPAVVQAYKQLWQVARLPSVLLLSLMLVTFRLGVLPAETAASLKLLEKGVAKEALAFLVLLQFPVEVASAVVAGRWSTRGAGPHQPFLMGYALRTLAAALGTALVYTFPKQQSSKGDTDGAHNLYLFSFAALGLVTSFSSTLMFTALGSFFNRISDPTMGGAYLTLLNTIMNMGVILPKSPMFWAMDVLTITTCRSPDGSTLAADCHARPGGLTVDGCAAAGGTCEVVLDGFYVVSGVMLVVGAALWVWYSRLLPRLEKLPLDHWRAPIPAAGAS